MAKEKKPQSNNQVLLLSALFLLVGLLMGYVFATNTNSGEIENLREQMQNDINNLQEQIVTQQVDSELE